jgi:hypothetical protein
VKRAAILALIVGVLAGILIGFPLAARAEAGECRVVKVLKSAGFKGHSLRVAYGIVMRESKGQNLAEDSPYFSGALGYWQVQTSAHSHNRWWSRAAMLNPLKQSRIVYRYMSKRGTYWRPWGLTPSGRGVDATQYAGWSSWQIANWIWIPYERYYQSFPQRCA